MTYPNDLLPCPFCGGDASLHAYRGSEMVGYVVTATIRCRACGASVSSVDSRDANGWSCKDDAKQKAIAAWNRRTPTAPDIAALIAIEEAKG